VSDVQAAPTPDLTTQIRDLLGRALSDALDSLSDVELHLHRDPEGRMVEYLDEAQMFVQDALFEALQKFGTREGDDFVWTDWEGGEVFRAPRKEVARVMADREAATIEVGA
jgi:hypothetical protein